MNEGGGVWYSVFHCCDVIGDREYLLSVGLESTFYGFCLYCWLSMRYYNMAGMLVCVY